MSRHALSSKNTVDARSARAFARAAGRARMVEPPTEFKGGPNICSTRIHRPAPKLISIEKTAEFLDVSPSTVRRLVSSRQLKAHKVGGQIRISMGDLVAFIDQGRV